MYIQRERGNSHFSLDRFSHGILGSQSGAQLTFFVHSISIVYCTPPPPQTHTHTHTHTHIQQYTSEREGFDVSDCVDGHLRHVSYAQLAGMVIFTRQATQRITAPAVDINAQIAKAPCTVMAGTFWCAAVKQVITQQAQVNPPVSFVHSLR